MIGIVVHGAEPVDSGYLSDVMERFPDVGEIMMAGTTGATSVIDAGLEGRVRILEQKLVSSSVRELIDTGLYEHILILNMGKTHDSSLRLASFIRHRVRESSIPVTLLDDGFHAVLFTGGDDGTYDTIKEFRPVRLDVPEFMEDGVRRLHGVLPGENIWVNGNVIGRATKSDPRIWRDENGLVFDGIVIRDRAFEHVRDFDHLHAKIRSGKVRRTTSTPRSLANTNGRGAMLVDHDAEGCLEGRDGVSIAVTIGDDTTRVAASLLFRFSIPVVGVTDGDEDGICDEALLYPGSVLLRVRSGCDDTVGELVRENLFKDSKIAKGKDPIEVVDAVRELASPYLLDETRF